MSEQLQGEHDAQKEADRILLARYSPAGVVINAELEILQFRGSTGAYLQPPAGKATLNLLKMAREGLLLPLRAAIQKAKKDDATIRKEGVRVSHDGTSRQVNLEVVPIKGLAANERCFLVLFEPAAEGSKQKAVGSRQEAESRKRKAEGGKQGAGGHQVARLQEELSATREYMQSLVEQHEAANEELQSQSEEIQSSNEELQSINEELETSKEELESSNEELATLNDELNNRNLELTTLNNDQSNLFVSASLPILMLGRDLRIRRFTPQAEKVLSLIATDVGRPIGDINLKVNVPDLKELIIEVIDTISIREREVLDKDGRWYALRVRPYKTLDNRIDGAVVVLADIDALKRSEAAISAARDYAEAIIRTVRDPLLILNADLRLHTANEAFYSTFKVSPVESEGRLIYELGNRQWDIPRLRELLEEVLPRNSFFDNFEVTHNFETMGERTMLLNARRLDDPTGQPSRILLGIEDVTEVKHFQAAMRRSELRYRRLFEAAQDGVLLVDPPTRKILDANPFMTKLLGYTREELVGKELFEIGLLKDEEDSRAAFRELQTKGFIRYEDLPFETNTGARREVEIVANLYHEDAEKIVQCNIRDITERKQSEEVLRRHTARFETLLNEVPLGVYLIDGDFRIRHVNPSTFQVFGDIPDLIGRDFDEVIHILWPQAYADEIVQLFRHTLETGEPYSTPERIEQRLDRGVTEYYEWQINRIPLPEGGYGVVCYFLDISAKVQAAEALRQSEQRFRLLADSAPVLIWVNGADGCEFVNRSYLEFLGVNAPDVRGYDWAQFVHPEDREGYVNAYLQVMKQRGMFEAEFRFRRHDGEYHWMKSVGQPRIGPGGELLGYVGCTADVTDIVKARQEAEEANRIKDEFLATVSHELRSPLNAILGWSNMLLGGKLDEQDAARAIETIARNARAQNQLIADLLDVSRIISGKLRFEVGAVDLNAVIEAAMETVRPAAAAKGVELRLTFDPTAGLVSGDDTRLQQVVWNLLSNAIKYTPRGGHVETRLAHAGSQVAISVRDTGEGISADFLPYVFARFRQADGTTTRQHGGLGLGLSIVRHLIEAHGGKVSAASEGAGQGATFTVTLPAIRDEGGGMKDESEGVFNHPSSLILHPSLTGLRVLVVDDDHDSRELLRFALTHDGAEVRTAASAAEALDILAQWDQWPTNALVSDIGLPDEDGYELIRRVRALPAERGGQVWAVALTGYASPIDQRRALAADYQMFMPKPVDLDKLAAAIARLAVPS